jgi:hypothetical protein
MRRWCVVAHTKAVARGTFNRMEARILALALAECEALEQAEKHSIRLHLSELSEKSLKQLADVVIQAVAQIRRLTQAMWD